MARTPGTPEVGTSRVVARLVDVGRMDPVYRDLYLHRARALLSALVSLQPYFRLERDQVEIDDLRRQVDDDSEVPLDPFASGIPFAFSPSTGNLAALRDRLVADLSALRWEDPAREAFYAERCGHFQALVLAPRTPASTATAAASLSAPFPAAALTRGRRLGLVSVQVDEVRQVAEYLGCCCVWHATLTDRPLTKPTRRIEGCTCTRTCTPDVPAVLRGTLDRLVVVHAFINSGGVRYLSGFAAEALLIEDFAEDEPAARSELLSALGLPRRRAVSRVALESSLLRYGPDVLEHELWLDPRRFRLVCIPFDVYGRLAPGRGWGQRELRTHFDGYEVWDGGTPRALVGGNVHSGGPYDLGSLGREDEREDVIVRLAVVRRLRLTRVGGGRNGPEGVGNEDGAVGGHHAGRAGAGGECGRRVGAGGHGHDRSQGEHAGVGGDQGG